MELRSPPWPATSEHNKEILERVVPHRGVHERVFAGRHQTAAAAVLELVCIGRRQTAASPVGR
jgi:hypothetical protein